MPFSGYIFDVEGTLVDSVRQSTLSLQETLVEFGIETPYDLLQLYAGLDIDQTLQIIAAELNPSERARILERQSDLYLSHYIQDVRAFGDVRETLKSLRYAGGKIALATDCKGQRLQHYLSLLNINDVIHSLACGDDVDHGKPDPRLVGRALRKLGTPGNQSVMIGDTPYDAEAAREAGTHAAGLLSGGFAKSVLSDAGCFAVASDLTALYPYLIRGAPRPSRSPADGLAKSA
jgi:HAD superfamily hydrolase (TIGR01549 family)